MGLFILKPSYTLLLISSTETSAPFPWKSCTRTGQALQKGIKWDIIWKSRQKSRSCFSYYACVCVLSHFGHVWLIATLRTMAHQVPLSMGCSRQQYWCGLPCPPPGDLPDPGIKPVSLMSPALAGRFFTMTWIWVDSRSWWWTGRPGVLQFMGSQRVGHDWATELNWVLPGKTYITYTIFK